MINYKLFILLLFKFLGVKNWQHVANCLPGRAANQCHVRWRQESRVDQTKSGKWSDIEERKLILSVLAYGEKNLSNTIEVMNGSNSNTNNQSGSCSRSELISTSNSTQRIKNDRDYKIWMKISQHVPGRSAFLIKKISFFIF